LVRSPRPAYVQEWRGPDLIAQIRSLQAHGPFDCVWVERAYLASAARAAGIRASIVDVDDVESQSFGRHVRSLGLIQSRPIEQAELVKIRVYEWSLTFRYPVLVCKDEDRRLSPIPRGCTCCQTAQWYLLDHVLTRLRPWTCSSLVQWDTGRMWMPSSGSSTVCFRKSARSDRPQRFVWLDVPHTC
jgi:hypothetical protein